MKCEYSEETGNQRIRCTKGDYCLYQYWCNSQRKFVSSATPQKCKNYKEKEIKKSE